MKGRASLAMLMGLVAILAVGLAAMKVATEPLARIVFGSGMLAVLVATLVALVRRGGRARWIGFALFGWAYALVLLVPPFRESVATKLPGSWTLDEALGKLVDQLQPPIPDPTEPPGKSPSIFLIKEDASGWHYEERGRIVNLAPEERKPWATYLGLRNARDARIEAAEGARRIALTFLGLAFALVGSVAGNALGDRPTDAGRSPATGTPALPG